MAEKKEIPPHKAVTPECILSFPKLDKPVKFKDADADKLPRYEAAFLIKKTPGVTEWQKDPALAALKGGIAAALDKGWPDKATRSKKLRLPVRDGDDEEYEGYAGHWFVNSGETRRPLLVNGRREPVSPEDAAFAELFYAGAIVKAQLEFYPFNKATGSGVAVGLKMIQFRRHGVRVSGGTNDNPEDVFDEADGADQPAAEDNDDLI